MHTEGDEIHVDETEASGGSKEGVVRWVLGVGLVLAIILLSLIWIVPALMQNDIEQEATVSGKLDAQQEGDSTDSIVGIDGDADEMESAADSEIDTPLDTIEN